MKPELRLIDLLIEKARRDLLVFSSLTKKDFVIAPHIKLLASALMKVEKGEIKRLMVFMPPRHGKSEMCSVRFPAFFLGRNPEKRIILTSYGATLAHKFSRQVRGVIESPQFSRIFKNVSISQERRAMNEFETCLKGGLLAAGVDGAVTGYGANLLIIDDPIKSRKEADSRTYRESVYRWFREVAETRLEPGASIILIMSRWHEDDLAGRLLKEEKDDWEVLSLKALAEKGDPLSRKEGEALWPERFSEKELHLIKERLGSYAFSALYQGEPVPEEASLIRRDWIRWYEMLPPGVSFYAGIDTATSKKDVADYSSVCEVARDNEGFLYVNHVTLERLSVLALANYVLSRYHVLGFKSVLIETNAAGEAIRQRIEELSREKGVYVPIKGVQATTDKVSRLFEISPFIENGTIRFNFKNEAILRMVDRLILMPKVDIDDDIDAFYYAVKAAMSSSKRAWLDFYRKEVERSVISEAPFRA